MIKALLASTVVAFGLMFSGMAHADKPITIADACMSSDEVWSRNQVEAKEHGLTLDHVVLKGDNAKFLFDYLNKKFEGHALPFDEIEFITNKLDDTAPVMMIIFEKGCVVAGGPIQPNEFLELVNAMAAQAEPSIPATPKAVPADPEVINPDGI